MQCSTTFTGSALLAELLSSDQMTDASARAWLVRKTGLGFDPEAMYELRWQDDEDSPTWSGYQDMHVHIMNDLELLGLEREYRMRNRLPARMPWMASMYESSMGRSSGRRAR